MKKILVLMLSLMITAVGVPVYANTMPKNVENKVVEKISQDQELVMLLSDAMELYLDLNKEDDKHLKNALKKELLTGFKVIFSDNIDKDKIKESIKSLQKTLFEYEEKVKNDGIKGRIELVDKILKLEEKLVKEKLSKEEAKKIEEDLEKLYKKLEVMDEELEDNWEDESEEDFEDDWEDESEEEFECDWEDEFEEDFEDGWEDESYEDYEENQNDKE